MAKQRVFGRHTALVGGEPAESILRIVRAFSLGVDGVGRVTLENTARGPDAATFQRAYDAVERDLLDAEQWCAAPWEHATLNAHDHWWMTMCALMWQAKQVVREPARVEWGWCATWRRPACPVGRGAIG